MRRGTINLQFTLGSFSIRTAGKAHMTTRLVNLYDLECYTFGTKDPQMEKDESVQARMNRMRQKYEEEGIKRTVEGVMIVQHHQHPHILLTKIGDSFFKL